MENHIDTPMFILLPLLLIITLPYLHLFFIFLVMGIHDSFINISKNIGLVVKYI